MRETTTVNTNITLTVKDFAEYDAAMVIWHYISPLLLLVGTVGSILSIVVLSRTRLHSATTKFYLVLLACNDVIVLNLGLLHYWMDYTFNFNLRNTSSFACKVHTLAVTLFLDYSAWIIVMLTVDRCICVCLPAKESQFCNIRNARIVSAVVFLMLLAVNMHFLWTYDVVDRIMFGRTIDCYVGRQEYKYFAQYVWTWIDFCVFSSIPFVIMVVGNVLILRELRISSKKLQVHRERSSRSTCHSLKHPDSSICFLEHSPPANSHFVDTSSIPEECSLPSEAMSEVTSRVMDPMPQANVHVMDHMHDENMHVKCPMPEANSLVTDSVPEMIPSETEITEGPQTVKPVSSNVLPVYDLQQDRPSPTENTHFVDPITEENSLTTDAQSEAISHVMDPKPEATLNVMDSMTESNSHITDPMREDNSLVRDAMPETIPSKLGTAESRQSIDFKIMMTKKMSKFKLFKLLFRRTHHTKLAVMLLSINCTFLLLTSPIVIYLIGLSHWQVSPDVHEEAELMLGWAVTSILQYADNSIHFFQYYLTIPCFGKVFWSTFGKPRIDPKVKRRQLTNITLTVKDFAEYDAAMVIWRYISPLLLLVGTVGSILSVVVLSRTRLHSATTKFYLVQLACNDVIVLNLGLLHNWMDYTFSFNISNTSSFACKVHALAVTLFLDYSARIIVMLTVERCICVCLPTKESQVCNIRNARIVSAVVFLMLLVVNMHFLWTHDVVEIGMHGRKKDCYIGRLEYKYFVEYVWTWIDFFVFSSNPFVIMVVGNILILRNLRISSRKLQDHRE
ncbi:uncharacterized protein LOC121370158 [Gigantopelta aegis]|uniref:uncharacterized protein LOC121370158 n=1 Tax=Gigantopelta aegis TaxID=1735272 RepID=UPI001B887818|nr:uncharacterized protein LOC121370158 [Gigantopelta aegis]